MFMAQRARNTSTGTGPVVGTLPSCWNQKMKHSKVYLQAAVWCFWAERVIFQGRGRWGRERNQCWSGWDRQSPAPLDPMLCVRLKRPIVVPAPFTQEKVPFPMKTSSSLSGSAGCSSRCFGAAVPDRTTSLRFGLPIGSGVVYYYLVGETVLLNPCQSILDAHV